ncbi:putative benzoate 4-monooxygenase cytochrome P450 [Aspergillus pseudoustus]|uniref:Benzoate 4-monooxygenase cytochrome P450 n=1 Tax=Aspergillus pseudoustus TaxID=1810923 RepID=A0ABR4IVT0_9EURO
MLPDSDSISTYIAYGLGLYLAYLAVIVTYRLTLHPLARVPGPRLAKITYLYEWYHDLYLLGQFPFKLKGLHQEYGPIVRITPDEVHIRDPDFTAKLYTRSNGRVDKPPRAAETFGPFPAAISTALHDHHRLRRSALNPFFSRKSVGELVPAMTHAIDILCERLQKSASASTAGGGELANLKYVYAAVTSDIIDGYCFARAPSKILKRDFGKKFFDDIDSFLEVSLLNWHVPTIMRLSFALPDWVNKLLAPAMAAMLDFRQDLGRQIDDIRHGRDKAHEGIGHRTVLHELVGSALPPAELKTPRLRDEAFSLMVAGSGTTAYTLRATTYHIAANPSIHRKLYNELHSAIPDLSRPPPPSQLLSTLEELPYLTAVIREGLRLAEPVTHRLPRNFPDKTLTYGQYTLPPGTVISMTGTLAHQDPTLFGDPYTFDPERWLGERGKQHEAYLVPFSKGTRICLGMKLAMAELYLILGMVFRRFDFDVSRVDRRRDVDVTYSFVLAAQARTSPGLEVIVRDVASS